MDTGNTQNKQDGTICGCTARNTLKSCYGGVCTDTEICDSTICGVDAACDDKEPGRDRFWYVDTTGNHIADQWFYYGLPSDTFIVADIG